MKIEEEQILHVAALAKLRIEKEDLEKWSEQMGAIIAFADSLGALPICETEAETDCGAAITNVFREDERKDSYPLDAILQNAPEQYDGCYVVPKIVE